MLNSGISRLLVKCLLISATFWLTSDSIAQDGCTIRYRYDAAGNRISRDWYCWTGDPDPDETDVDRMAQHDDPGQLKKAEASTGPLSETQLLVFPNPASTSITIHLSDPIHDASMDVIDTQGHILVSGRITGTTAHMDVSGLAVGSYFIRVSTEEDMLISSFAVSHP